MTSFQSFFKTLKQLITYGINAGLSAVVDVSIFGLILYFLKPIWGAAIAIIISGVIARITSSLVNFALNKKLFCRGTKESNRKSMCRYYILWVNILVLSLSSIYLLHDLLHMNEVLAKIITDCVLGLFCYQIQKKWVFAPQRTCLKKGLYFKVVRSIARLFLKRKVVIDPSTFASGKVFVGHHQNFYGPVSACAWLPDTVHLWVISHLFHYKDCFSMYYHFTFRQQCHYPKFLAMPLAFFCGLLIPPFIRSLNAVPVYRDSGSITKTLKQSIDILQKGHQLLIFPDVQYDSNQKEIQEIYTGFLYLDKLYYKKEQTHLEFVPMLFEKASKTISTATPISFSAQTDYHTEQASISKKIVTAINGN